MIVSTDKIKRLKTALCTLIVALLACAFVATPTMAAASKRAAMVMDANTGRILYNDGGDALRHPASLTKMMTIYMAFDLMKQGRLTAGTLIKISKTAAAQPPSKLGLKPGKKIKLIHAIKSLVTKSANDIAVAIAEHIGGSEYNFARLMTRKANAMGMTRTVFKNASGLPNAAQVTTARDMLTLALRLQDDFPKLYKLFKTRRFTYRGKTYKNHNTLLGRVSGVDGIKTGYIRASGFNLVTSIRKNGRHVVAAVFGGKTARRRNTRMRGLLTQYVKKASLKKTRRTRPRLIAAPNRAIPPTRKPARPAPREKLAWHTPSKPIITIAKVRHVDVLTKKTARPRRINRAPLAPIARKRAAPVKTKTVALLSNGTVRGRSPSTLQAQLASLLAKNQPEFATRNVQAARAPNSAAYQPHISQTVSIRAPKQNASATYQIQIGAYKTTAEAERRLSLVAQQASNLLNGYRPLTQPVDRGARTLYRARFAGFEAATATTTCRQLRNQNIDCLVAR